MEQMYKIAYKTCEGHFHREVCNESELQIAKINIKRDHAILLYVRKVEKYDFETVVSVCDDETLKTILDNCINRLYLISKFGVERSKVLACDVSTEYKEIIKEHILKASNSALRCCVEHCVSELYHRTSSNWDRDVHGLGDSDEIS